MPSNRTIIECGCYHAESNTCGMDLLVCAETACPYGKYVEAPDPAYCRCVPFLFPDPNDPVFGGKMVSMFDEDGNVNWRLAFALP